MLGPYLAGVTEYLAGEVLYVAGKAALDEGEANIRPRHLSQARSQLKMWNIEEYKMPKTRVKNGSI